MRIASSQIFDSGLRGIQDLQSSVARTQQEISAGKRQLSPADDPAAATLIDRIQQDAARSDQYLRNIDVAERDLRLEESQIGTVEDALFRLRELFVAAGNGAYGRSERESIAAELEAKAIELQGLFNGQGANGEYLFGGYLGDSPPFVTRTGGAVEYRGDTGQRYLQVSTGMDIAVRDNGQELFEAIPAANRTFVTRMGVSNTGAGDIDPGRVIDQAAYDAVYPDDVVLRFDAPLGPGSFSAYRRDRDTGTLSLISTQAFVPGMPLRVAGAEVKLVGTPAANDEFVLEASNRQPLITTIQRMASALRLSDDSTQGRAERGAAIAEGLANLTLAESHIFAKRADFGSRLDLVDSARADQQQGKLINQELLSKVQDLDFSEAISRLSYQNFVLEAAQKSMAKVAGISLFDYL
jgi:flagellar hook-associated protein 3 FlgL